MLDLIGQALYFFLPAYLGNAAPVLLERLGWWRSLKRPIDGGRRLWGEPLLGKTKTWRGLFGGALMGIMTVAAQTCLYAWVPSIRPWYLFSYEFPYILLLGLYLGLGEGLGDALKSFFKRRLHIESSGPFFPLDQMSFLGALFLAFLYYVPPLEHVIAIVVASPFIPVAANLVAYKLGWKKVWY